MKYKVLISFGGQVNGTAGQQIDITDESIARDLLRAKYIAPLAEPPKPVKKTTSRKKAKAEG